MKKLSLTFSLIITALLLSTTLVSAATTTPKATTAPKTTEAKEPTEAPEPTKTQDEKIKEKLKNASVQGVSTDDQKKRGFIGTVKRVSEEALTVETRHGTEIITLSPDVSILQDNKPFLVNNIEIDSQLVIMGYQDGEDFIPKRVLVLKKPLQSAKKSVWVGSIKKMEKISGNAFVAFIIQTRADEEKSFSQNSKTLVEDDNGQPIKSTELETDQDVLLITVPEEATSQTVKDSSGKIVRIHSLVASDATPATSAKTTPTATPKVTGKATATPKASTTKKPTATPAE